MLVKMQLSLSSSDGICWLRMYNQDRDYDVQMPSTPEIDQLFARNGLPQYAKAKFFAEIKLTYEAPNFAIEKILPNDLGW